MLVILGKNGSGKSYLANKLLNLGFYRSINYTTRPKRDTEIDGMDYKFITTEEFEKLILEDYFVEYKKRDKNYYGTPKQNIRQNAILLAGDVKKIQKNATDEVLSLYIDANIEERFKRVELRGELRETLFKRFHDENFSYLYDFNGFFIDNNNKTDESLNSIMSIIDSSGKIRNKSLLSNNISFLQSKIKILPNQTDNEMLSFLKFEEYLMRKILLMFNLDDINCYKKVIQYYYDCIEEYLIQNYITQTRKSLEELEIILDNQKYQVDFQKEKVFRRR